MTKKEEMRMREEIALAIQKMEVEGLDFEGEVVEGLAFSCEDRTFIIKTILKKEDFDLADAMEEFEEREAKRIEREQKAQEKLDRVNREKEKQKEKRSKKKEEKTE